MTETSEEREYKKSCTFKPNLGATKKMNLRFHSKLLPEVIEEHSPRHGRRDPQMINQSMDSKLNNRISCRSTKQLRPGNAAESRPTFDKYAKPNTLMFSLNLGSN